MEVNLSAKCTKITFYPNINEEVAKYTSAELARRGDNTQTDIFITTLE